MKGQAPRGWAGCLCVKIGVFCSQRPRLPTRSRQFFFPSPSLPPGWRPDHRRKPPPNLLTPSHTHPPSKPAPTRMATWASFTTIDDALTHNLTLALPGLDHARIRGGNVVVALFIGMREVMGARPPDAVLGVCARGEGACPGHRLPLDSSAQAFTCCVECSALVASADPNNVVARRAAGAVKGKHTPTGWVGLTTCRGPASPRPGGLSRRPYLTRTAATQPGCTLLTCPHLQTRLPRWRPPSRTPPVPRSTKPSRTT